jgi:hypothetical protein
MFNNWRAGGVQLQIVMVSISVVKGQTSTFGGGV